MCRTDDLSLDPLQLRCSRQTDRQTDRLQQQPVSVSATHPKVRRKGIHGRETCPEIVGLFSTQKVDSESVTENQLVVPPIYSHLCKKTQESAQKDGGGTNVFVFTGAGAPLLCYFLELPKFIGFYEELDDPSDRSDGLFMDSVITDRTARPIFNQLRTNQIELLMGLSVGYYKLQRSRVAGPNAAQSVEPSFSSIPPLFQVRALIVSLEKRQNLRRSFCAYPSSQQVAPGLNFPDEIFEIVGRQ